MNLSNFSMSLLGVFGLVFDIILWTTSRYIERESIKKECVMYTEKTCLSYTHINPSVRLSFQAVLEDVKRQVEYDRFEDDCEQAEGICKIIAEVLKLNPEGEIKVGEERIPVSMMQEVFRELQFEHVEFALAKYGKVTSLICNKKAYIRTALYNSYFELEVHYVNQVNHDLGI